MHREHQGDERGGRTADGDKDARAEAGPDGPEDATGSGARFGGGRSGEQQRARHEKRDEEEGDRRHLAPEVRGRARPGGRRR